MTTLHADFETRSFANIRDTGVYVYAGHPTTDIWCLRYAFDDGPVGIWRPGEPVPADVVTHVALGLGIMVGHNVGFEWAIWNAILVPRYGFPALPITSCYCTAAMAAAMSLPRDLAGAATALGLEVGKDMDGRRLMLQMAKPRKIKGDADLDDPDLKRIGPRDWSEETYRDSAGRTSVIQWWGDGDRRQRLEAYCGTDVEVEREVEKRTLPLSAAEREVWLLDHKINGRGMHCDLDSVRKAEAVVAVAKADLDARMNEVTGGAVSACSKVHDLAQWVKGRGVKTDSLDKAAIAALLGRDNLPQDVREALELRREGAKTSTAKLGKMQLGASRDGRLRDLYMYHGAHSGRWTGMRVQSQNLPRPSRKFPEVEEVFGILEGVT